MFDAYFHVTAVDSGNQFVPEDGAEKTYIVYQCDYCDETFHAEPPDIREVNRLILAHLRDDHPGEL